MYNGWFPYLKAEMFFLMQPLWIRRCDFNLPQEPLVRPSVIQCDERRQDAAETSQHDLTISLIEPLEESSLIDHFKPLPIGLLLKRGVGPPTVVVNYMNM